MENQKVIDIYSYKTTKQYCNKNNIAGFKTISTLNPTLLNHSFVIQVIIVLLKISILKIKQFHVKKITLFDRCGSVV